MWKSVVGVVGEEGYRDRGGVVERECDKSGDLAGSCRAEVEAGERLAWGGNVSVLLCVSSGWI